MQTLAVRQIRAGFCILRRLQEGLILDKQHLVTRRYFFILMLGYGIWVLLYYVTGWIGELRGPAFDPSLPLDKTILFIPALFYIYFLCYIIVLSLFLISRSPAFLNRAFLTIIAANAAAFLFFALFPTQGPPREFLVAGSDFERLPLALIHLMDERWNALPSLHVTNPWLVAMLSVKERGWAGISILFLIVAVAISVSTLFVHQHYLLDVLAGMALAGLSFTVLSRFEISEKPW